MATGTLTPAAVVLTLGILTLSTQFYVLPTQLSACGKNTGDVHRFIISLGHRLEDNLEDQLAVLRTT